MSRYRELAQQERAIKEAIDFGKSLEMGRPERAMIARFVCILASGFIENVVRLHLIKFAQKSRPKPELACYVASSVGRFQNPKFDQILKLTGQFSDNWRKKLEQIDDSIKTAIESIVSNRHLIAHGATSQISLAQVEQYMERLKEFARHFEALCK